MTYKRQGLKQIPDQGSEGSCTAFATCNIINGYKDPKWKKAGAERDYIDGAKFFELVNSKYPHELQGALTPPMALQFAKDMGYIADYQMLKKNQEKASVIKNLLKNGFLLLLVLTKVDWETTERTGKLKRAEGQKVSLPHSLCCCAIEEGKIKIINSWGEKRGIDGYFYADDEELEHCLSQAYAVVDSDDRNNINKLLYTKKILDAVQIISGQRKYGTEREKQAMNFANSMLRKVCLKQNHQRNMSKDQVLDFVNKNF